MTEKRATMSIENLAPPPSGRLLVKRQGSSITRRIPKPVVVIDTREQVPLDFAATSNWIGGTTRRKLDAGDYSSAPPPTQTRFPAHWTRSKPGLGSRSSTPRSTGHWQRKRPRVGYRSTSPTGTWRRRGWGVSSKPGTSNLRSRILRQTQTSRKESSCNPTIPLS